MALFFDGPLDVVLCKAGISKCLIKFFTQFDSSCWGHSVEVIHKYVANHCERLDVLFFTKLLADKRQILVEKSAHLRHITSQSLAYEVIQIMDNCSLFNVFSFALPLKGSVQIDDTCTPYIESRVYESPFVGQLLVFAKDARSSCFKAEIVQSIEVDGDTEGWVLNCCRNLLCNLLIPICHFKEMNSLVIDWFCLHGLLFKELRLIICFYFLLISFLSRWLILSIVCYISAK